MLRPHAPGQYLPISRAERAAKRCPFRVFALAQQMNASAPKETVVSMPERQVDAWCRRTARWLSKNFSAIADDERLIRHHMERDAYELGEFALRRCRQFCDNPGKPISGCATQSSSMPSHNDIEAQGRHVNIHHLKTSSGGYGRGYECQCVIHAHKRLQRRVAGQSGNHGATNLLSAKEIIQSAAQIAYATGEIYMRMGRHIAQLLYLPRQHRTFPSNTAVMVASQCVPY